MLVLEVMMENDENEYVNVGCEQLMVLIIRYENYKEMIDIENQFS